MNLGQINTAKDGSQFGHLIHSFQTLQSTYTRLFWAQQKDLNEIGKFTLLLLWELDFEQFHIIGLA